MSRPKGSANKTTKEAKQLVLDAVNELGGVKWLKQVAEEHPVEFLKLLARLIPKAIDKKVDKSVALTIVSEFDEVELRATKYTQDEDFA